MGSTRMTRAECRECPNSYDSTAVGHGCCYAAGHPDVIAWVRSNSRTGHLDRSLPEVGCPMASSSVKTVGRREVSNG
jgi:hypothetical protein